MCTVRRCFARDDEEASPCPSKALGTSRTHRANKLNDCARPMVTIIGRACWRLLIVVGPLQLGTQRQIEQHERRTTRGRTTRQYHGPSQCCERVTIIISTCPRQAAKSAALSFTVALVGHVSSLRELLRAHEALRAQTTACVWR